MGSGSDWQIEDLAAVTELGHPKRLTHTGTDRHRHRLRYTHTMSMFFEVPGLSQTRQLIKLFHEQTY